MYSHVAKPPCFDYKGVKTWFTKEGWLGKTRPGVPRFHNAWLVGGRKQWPVRDSSTVNELMDGTFWQTLSTCSQKHVQRGMPPAIKRALNFELIKSNCSFCGNTSRYSVHFSLSKSSMCLRALATNPQISSLQQRRRIFQTNAQHDPVEQTWARQVRTCHKGEAGKGSSVQNPPTTQGGSLRENKRREKCSYKQFSQKDHV